MLPVSIHSKPRETSLATLYVVALIRLVNDGKRFPKVTEALAVTHDNELSSEHEDIVFIVPRNDNVC